MRTSAQWWSEVREDEALEAALNNHLASLNAIGLIPVEMI